MSISLLYPGINYATILCHITHGDMWHHKKYFCFLGSTIWGEFDNFVIKNIFDQQSLDFIFTTPHHSVKSPHKLKLFTLATKTILKFNFTVIGRRNYYVWHTKIIKLLFLHACKIRQTMYMTHVIFLFAINGWMKARNCKRLQ